MEEKEYSVCSGGGAVGKEEIGSFPHLLCVDT